MSHESHFEGKVLITEVKGDRRTPGKKTKIWDVDPQKQIIDLLTKQLVLLQKLVDRDPPYHTGARTVSLLPAGASIPPPPPKDSDEGSV